MSVLLSEQNGVHFILTLNRPEKRNALNQELIESLKSELNKVKNLDSVKTVTIRANGPVFCSGADLDMLKAISSFTEKQNSAETQSIADLFHLIYTFPKPVIAEVQGDAFAGGCGLATVCDFVFAAETVNFSYPEVKIGFIPAIVSWFLIHKIGEGKARELLLTGRMVQAPEAQRMGLINFIADSGQLPFEVDVFRSNLVSTVSVNSIAETKKLMADLHGKSLEDGLKQAVKTNVKIRQTPDCKEGIAAFLEKRKPRFLG